MLILTVLSRLTQRRPRAALSASAESGATPYARSYSRSIWLCTADARGGGVYRSCSAAPTRRRGGPAEAGRAARAGGAVDERARGSPGKAGVARSRESEPASGAPPAKLPPTAGDAGVDRAPRAPAEAGRAPGRYSSARFFDDASIAWTLDGAVAGGASSAGTVEVWTARARTRQRQ